MGERMWSGLAHVKPKTNGVLPEGAVGGYVNVVALADDKAVFLRRVSDAFDDLGLTVCEIEDIVLLDEDGSHELVSGAILALSEEITPDRPLWFGPIHTYEADTDIN